MTDLTDLTDRMRTCAAAIVAGAPDQPFMEWQLVYRDAADLLIEASNALERVVVAEVAGVPIPMEIIEPVVNEPDGSPDDPGPYTGTWITAGDTLPVTRPRACPACDSRAHKTVRRVENKLMIECPVCGHTWEFKR